MTTQMPDQKLENDLRALTETIQPDAHFMTALDARLRQTPLRPRFAIPVSRARRITVAAALLLGTFLSVWTVPSLRIIAQQVLNSLFNQAASDTHIFSYDNTLPIISSTPISKTFSEAQSIVQFRIYEPKGVPAAFGQPEITADATEVNFEYTLPGRYLSISEQLNTNGWQINGLIGASAKIIKVDIDGIAGEYVEGGWMSITTSPTPEQSRIGTEVGVWRFDIPTRKLRWQDGQVLYEIAERGGSPDIRDEYVSMSDMIAIAKSLR